MTSPGLRSLALLAWLAHPVLLPDRPVQQAAPKHVLVLFWYNKDYPGNVQFDRGFSAALQAARGDSVEYYQEYLETDRFPGDEQSRVLRDFLLRKYANLKLDVAVAAGLAPTAFLLENGPDIFPGTPIVSVGVDRPTDAQLVTGAGVTGILAQSSHRMTLDLALRLHPGTEHVFVVSGNLQHDGQFERLARAALDAYPSPAGISYMTDLAPDSLAAAMRALPPRSIVLFVWQQVKDAQGRLWETTELAELVAKSAPAPVYGMTDAYLGRGIEGGYVVTVEGNGRRAADLALEIARGTPARDIPFAAAPTVPMFDWRQLRRWGIRDFDLPAGSIVRFEAPTFWTRYRSYVVEALSVFVLEALLITILLVERSRRRQTTVALNQLNARLFNLQDEERQRIARELHDGTAQNLTAIALNCGRLSHHRGVRDPEARGILKDCQQLCEEAVREVRTLSYLLHPPQLDEAGLSSALLSYVDGFTMRSGIAVEIEVEPDLGRLPPPLEIALFRIVQESLTNIRRHSGSGSALISLARKGSEVVLRVVDRGRGLDPEKLVGPANSLGVGIPGMRQRMRQLGGRLDVSAGVQGTVVTASAPVGKRAQGDALLVAALAASISEAAPQPGDPT